MYEKLRDQRESNNLFIIRMKLGRMELYVELHIRIGLKQYL